MQCFWRVAVALQLAVSLTVMATGTAAAEDSQLPAGPAAVQPVPASPPVNNSLPAQPPPAFKSGFLHELGLWWNQGFGDFNTKMKNAKDRLDDLKRGSNDEGCNCGDPGGVEERGASCGAFAEHPRVRAP